MGFIIFHCSIFFSQGLNKFQLTAMETEMVAICFAGDGERMAVGGYSDHGPTHVSVLNGDNSVCESISTKYPITGVDWSHQLIGTTSEKLRIYNENLVELWSISASNSPGPPPLTSLDWNKSSPQWILTSSVDTTCTLWDLSSQKPSAHTRLIAHDAEVLDVKFLTGSTTLFGSCSTDGSLRLFDLRNLNQSTIAYEPGPMEKLPLLKMGVSTSNPNYISLVQGYSSEVVIIDLRNVGTPLAVVTSNNTVVSAQWHPFNNVLMTATSNGLVSLFDINSSIEVPNMVCSVAHGINSGAWNRQGNICAVTTPHGLRRIFL